MRADDLPDGCDDCPLARSLLEKAADELIESAGLPGVYQDRLPWRSVGLILQGSP